VQHMTAMDNACCDSLQTRVASSAHAQDQGVS
jgi:hypothetical protein